MTSSVNISIIHSVSVFFPQGYCQQNRVPSGIIVLRAILLEKPLKIIYHHKAF